MWTQEQRNAFCKNLVLTAHYFGKDLPVEVAAMMVDDLADENYEACCKALIAYRKRPGVRAAPSPADLVALIRPEISARSVAVGLAHKIKTAVSRHGWAWSHGIAGPNGLYWEDSRGNVFGSFREAVVSEIGEIGWHTICARGGWSHVRNAANELEEGIFIAQMRDQIQASYELQQSGVDLLAIAAPKKEQIADKTLTLINSIKPKEEEK